jgi:UDP-N-acetylmuramate-alanine ligase
VDRIIPMLRSKDVVVVFSNGGFDDIHEKLLARLRARA